MTACMCSDAYVGVYVYGGRGQPWGVFLSYHLLLFKIGSLLGQELAKWAGWPPSQTHGSTSFCLPSAHVTKIHTYWIFKCWFWGSNSDSLACKVDTLLTEPSPWPSCWLVLFKVLFCFHMRTLDLTSCLGQNLSKNFVTELQLQPLWPFPCLRFV